MGEDIEKIDGGGSSIIILGSTRGRTKNLHRDLEVPESSTVGLGARKKWRSRRRGVEKIHGSGVVDRVAVMADQGACAKKIMRETGIRDDIAVDRFRFIWELKYTRRRTIDGK